MKQRPSEQQTARISPVSAGSESAWDHEALALVGTLLAAALAVDDLLRLLFLLLFLLLLLGLTGRSWEQRT